MCKQRKYEFSELGSRYLQNEWDQVTSFLATITLSYSKNITKKNILQIMSKILIKIIIFTWCNDDNRAKKANLRIRQPKVIQPLGQLKDRVHEELGVSRRHGIDGVLPYDVSIKANQALQQINMTL